MQRASFRQAFFDGGEQGGRRKRLSQAARCAEFERHPQEVRRRRGMLREGVTGDRDQRDIGRALVKHPHRFKAAHFWHKDIDDHDVEAGGLQGVQAAEAAVRGMRPAAGRAACGATIASRNDAYSLLPPGMLHGHGAA
jgi:hypothetical protein